MAETLEAVDATPHGAMEHAVGQALAKIWHRGDETEPIPLHTVTKIGVFPVDSDKTPGYLVFAIDMSPSENQLVFLRTCEQALQETFQAMGISGKLESGFWLDVPEVSFAPWVENSGAFNFKMHHKDREVGVAYFHTPTAVTKPRATPDKNMFAIGIAEISTQEPVNFKAYLYLKENHKYYLYLRNGRQLQPEQKKRLEEKQIFDIFMKSGDLENLRIFLALAFLKESIKNSLDAA